LKIQELLKSDLLPFVSGLYENAHLILDKRGNILFANDAAGQLFKFQGSEKNIFDIFNGETSELFYSLLKGNTKEKEGTLLIQLNIREEKSRPYQLKYSPIHIEDENYLSCIFHKEEYRLGGSQEIKIRAEQSEAFNQEMLELIKRSFPFTMIGKDSLRKKADELKEFFWMKDLNGRFLLVNKAFADYLGVHPDKIEGTSEELYIPEYLRKVSSSLTDYMLNSGNGVSSSGVLYGSSPNVKERIELPLLSNDNKVFAITGITRSLKEEPSTYDNEGFDLLPRIAAVIDSSGFIKQSTEELRQLFNFDKKNGNIHYRKIFPDEVSSFCEQFLKTTAKEESRSFTGMIS
jgi:PAS domain-containing protein